MNAPRMLTSVVCLTAAMVFTTGLVGCAKGGENTPTSEKVSNANNNLIPRMNQISQELATMGIDVSQSRAVPNGLSDNQVARARSILAEYVRAGQEVTHTTNRTDVIYSDTTKLRTYIANADGYLRKLEGYEAAEKARIAGASADQAEKVRVATVTRELKNAVPVSDKMAADFQSKYAFAIDSDYNDPVTKLLVKALSENTLTQAISDAKAYTKYHKDLLAKVDALVASPEVNPEATPKLQAALRSLIGIGETAVKELMKVEAEAVKEPAALSAQPLLVRPPAAPPAKESRRVINNR